MPANKNEEDKMTAVLQKNIICIYALYSWRVVYSIMPLP